VQYMPGRKLDVPVNCLDIQLARLFAISCAAILGEYF